MPEIDLNPLAEALSAALKLHKLRPHWRAQMDNYGCAAFWRRCANSNRAVALVRAPNREFEVGPHAQWLKWRLLWQTRFVPLFYELGLQIILCGPGLEARFDVPEPLQSYVDKISNQFVVLQSLFVVDTDSKRFAAARTWGQILTGPVQDSIASTLQAVGFEPRESE